MSVIGFTTGELVDVMAAHWDYGSVGSSDAQRVLANMADTANRIAAANGLAYEATYSEPHEPEYFIEPRHIKSAIISMTVDRKLRAQRNLHSIRYNLIANNGQDFADAEILDGLLSLFRSALNLKTLAVRS